MALSTVEPLPMARTSPSRTISTAASAATSLASSLEKALMGPMRVDEMT